MGTRAPGNPARVLATSRSPLRHAPCPAKPIHSSSLAGAASIPNNGRFSLTSATETAQPLRPRMKSRVPSIGSTSQHRPFSSRSGWSTVSSDSHPAEGSKALATTKAAVAGPLASPRKRGRDSSGVAATCANGTSAHAVQKLWTSARGEAVEITVAFQGSEIENFADDHHKLSEALGRPRA